MFLDIPSKNFEEVGFIHNEVDEKTSIYLYKW